MNANTKAVVESLPFQQREAYDKGFLHGSNKVAPVKRALETARRDRDRWIQKYKAEVPQLKQTIEQLRAHVSPEVWAVVTQGHYKVIR